MKRRTRITLALSAMALAALGGAYGLVAQQGIPSTSSSAAPSTSSSALDAPAGSSTQTRVGSARSLVPAVVHSQTRGS